MYEYLHVVPPMHSVLYYHVVMTQSEQSEVASQSAHGTRGNEKQIKYETHQISFINETTKLLLKFHHLVECTDCVGKPSTTYVRFYRQTDLAVFIRANGREREDENKVYVRTLVFHDYSS